MIGKKGALAVKKRNKIIWGIAALLLVGLSVWRLWPRSIDSFMEFPSRDTDRVSCYLTICGVENGQAVNHTYKLETKTRQESREIINILRRGQYQASLMNLLPWTWGSLSSGSRYDGRNITVAVFSDGDEPGASFMIFMGGDNRADVDGRRINPIGGDMFDELAEYILAEGQPNSP